MAKTPGELLHAAGDRLHDVAGFAMHCVDIVYRRIDQESEPVIDKLYVQALKMQYWILEHTTIEEGVTKEGINHNGR